MADGETLDELEGQGRNIDRVLEHLLDHLPRREVAPRDCRFFERDRWFMVAPDGTIYTHSPGGAWRLRILPDGSEELSGFREGQEVERITRPPHPGGHDGP